MNKYEREKRMCGWIVEAAFRAIEEQHPDSQVHMVTEYGTGRLKGFMVFTGEGTLGINMEISPWTPDPAIIPEFQG